MAGESGGLFIVCSFCYTELNSRKRKDMVRRTGRGNGSGEAPSGQLFQEEHQGESQLPPAEVSLGFALQPGLKTS